jgi:O-antigen biosynthesis protein
VTAEQKPKLEASVIIPTRGRAELLVESVESIIAGDALPIEIVIVDQSPAPNGELAAVSSDPDSVVRYYHRPWIPGTSAARNEAVALARGPVLAFTDDDVIVEADWLRTIVAAISEDPTVLITGRVLPVESETGNGFAPSCIEVEEPRIYKGRIWDDALYSNNMGFMRDVFEALGPFDERLGVGAPYPNASDNDYCLRALEAGYRISYRPDVVVHHRAWRPMSVYPKLMWKYGFGQGAFLMKHARLSDRYTLIRLRESVRQHARDAFRLRREDRARSRGEAAFALGSIAGSTKWLLLETLRGR